RTSRIARRFGLSGRQTSSGRFCRIALAGDGTFFFQAEDGIRVLYVTGVQTCALPIFYISFAFALLAFGQEGGPKERVRFLDGKRSEERRVGKEGRAGRPVGL